MLRFAMSVALPSVLIGPILRRVEPRLVSVFIATSKPASAHLSVFEGIVDIESPPSELITGDAPTMPFGASFNAIVVTASLPQEQTLKPAHRYSYNLKLAFTDGTEATLQSLGMLDDSTVTGYARHPEGVEVPEADDIPPGAPRPSSFKVEICSIGYAKNQLPSFVTPPDKVDDLVLAHVSCRKPHGAGDAALHYLDDYLGDLNGEATGWIHRLFMTGDQIYADDVADALLPGINSLGIALVSGEGANLGVEEVPRPIGSGTLKLNMEDLPAGFRQKAIGRSGLTSDAGASHLIGFGEWLATYCIAWNPDVWPVLAVCDTNAPSAEDALLARLRRDVATSPEDAPIVLGFPAADTDSPDSHLTPLFASTEPARAALKSRLEAFVGTKDSLDSYRREVPKVRRLLANVPTYMIADDHEITDDWFMTGGIRAACTGRPMGQAMMRNGMAAYTICQAWGNDPVLWSTDADHKALLAAISGMFGAGWTGGLPLPAHSGKVDELLGLSPQAAPKFDYAFSLDGPGHKVRVLDTRTRREYPTPYEPPVLLTAEAMDQQLPPGEQLPDGDVLIVVSPVPVYGPAVMTELGGVITAQVDDLKRMTRNKTKRSEAQDTTGINQGNPVGMEAFDAEHWGANPAALERLLQRLAHNPRVIVLGGDVHYAGSFAMDWTGSASSTEPIRSSRIVHFTSSAGKNGWETRIRNLMMLNGMSTGMQRIGMPMTRVGWTNAEPEVIDKLGEEGPLPRLRLKSSPVLLSDELLRHRHAFTRAPEWTWKADTIVDVRPSADRPTAARSPSLGAELPAGVDAIRGYADLAAAHTQALTSAAIARGLQFLNNVGVISFKREADGLHVRQSLYSLRPRPEPNETAAAYIVHETLLEPDPIEMPTGIGPVDPPPAAPNP